VAPAARTGAAALALCLLGCGHQPAQSAAATAGPVVVTFAHGETDPVDAVLDEERAFEATHPGIRIEDEVVPWQQGLVTTMLAAAGTDQPDVAEIGRSWLAPIAQYGTLHTFTQAELASLGGKDAFVSTAWHDVAGAKGPLSIPWWLETRLLFYRTDVFAKYSIDPDTAFATWSSFERTVQLLRQHGFDEPFALPTAGDTNVYISLMPFIWQAGGTVIDPRTSTPTLARPATVAAVDEVQTLIGTTSAGVPTARDASAVDAAFRDGNVPIVMSGPWLAAGLRHVDQTSVAARSGWAAHTLPSGPDGAADFLGGGELVLFENSPHHDAAMEWIRFLTSAKSQGRFTDAVNDFPARKGALTTKEASKPEFAVMSEEMLAARDTPSLPGWAQVEGILQRTLQQLWATDIQKKSPRTTADIRHMCALIEPAIAQALNSSGG
jgi:multiple sugar transport system substrate-binding protein